MMSAVLYWADNTTTSSALLMAIWDEYIKPELDVPKSTEWQKTNQSQVCPMRFDHCHDLFRGELSINRAIFDHIYLGTEITGDLCGVFDKTDAQWWNESHVHFYYVTMQSTCSHGDKSLVFVSRNVIGKWSHITIDHYGNVTCLYTCKQGDGSCQLTCSKPEGGGEKWVYMGWRWLLIHGQCWQHAQCPVILLLSATAAWLTSI